MDIYSKDVGSRIIFLGFCSLTIMAFLVFSLDKERVRAAESSFRYEFSSGGILKDADHVDQSSSPYWWLRLGGAMEISGGVGRTLRGALPGGDVIRRTYAALYPTASDNGYHPQNLFRLLTRTRWADLDQKISVKVLADNLGNSVNRNPWNGISLVGRYQGASTHYLATIRMDGYAVIKKKMNDTYSTLASKKFFPGTYSKSLAPNLLPKGAYFDMRMEVTTSADGSVTLRFFIDEARNGSWQLAAEARDISQPILEDGMAGVFGDFMDLEFDNYEIAGQGEAAPTYGLDAHTTVEETGSLGESENPDWWVNSGAYFTVENAIGKTVQGKLATGNVWQVVYALSNPVDTDGGYHPQNIFRLVTKKTWRDYTQEAYFRVNEYYESASPNRAAHNGVLFFNRYRDGQNLYYTGLRVDGNAVIKKKIDGTYYTMALSKVLGGTYNRSSNPNLIPEDAWFGLRSMLKNNPNGTLKIELYLDRYANGNWTLIAEVTDFGTSYGPVHGEEAHAGVRTDFMDVEMKEYRVTSL